MSDSSEPARRPAPQPAAPARSSSDRRGIAGRRYRLRGADVTVTTAWNGSRQGLPAPLPHVRTRAQAPRNVAIRLPDGTTTIRPFRGLTRSDTGQ